MDAQGLAPGSEIGGYRIVAPLGSGGMGTVYRAEDGGGNPVALKLLHPHVGADPASRQRLRREVAALQRLRHAGVAAVLDAEADSSEAFLVTELVEGSTLEEHVRDHGPLAAADLADLADGLRDALEAVHAAGVVHRDLKPSNVMLTDEGPVLIDFGIAQAADEVRVTSTGFVVGTPGYLAPELLADGAPDAATDWWGWAAVLAFAATGRAPFGTRPMEAVIARTRAGDVDLIGLGARTAAALEGALDPHPGRRTAPDDVVAELEAAADADDAPVTQVLPAPVPLRPSTRTRALTGAAPDDAATRALPDDAATRALPDDAATRALPDDAATRALRPEPATVALPQDGRTRALPVVPADPAGQWDGAEEGPYGAGDRYAGPVTHGSGTGYAGPAAPGGYGGPDASGARDPYGPGEPTGGWADDALDGTGDARPVPGADGATAYVPPRPRRRASTVLGLGLLAVAGATLYPGITVLVVAAALVLFRTVGTAAEAVQRRRERRGGATRGDVVRAVLASPWHLVRGLVGLLPSLLVAASVVTVVGGLLWWALQTGRLTIPAWGIAPEADGAGPAGTWTASAVLGIAVLAGLVAGWWGPLARGTREGARWTLGALAPGWSGAAVLTALTLAAAAVLAVLAATGQPITWWPLPGPPDVR
jgi:hypothetical protein